MSENSTAVEVAPTTSENMSIEALIAQRIEQRSGPIELEQDPEIELENPEIQDPEIDPEIDEDPLEVEDPELDPEDPEQDEIDLI